VNVSDVNTLNRVGKRLRTRRGFGQRSDTKRAIVSIAASDRIDIFAGPAPLGPHGHLHENQDATMGIRKYKPTTRPPRCSSVADFAEVTRYDSGEVADPPAAQHRWPQRARPNHHSAPGWRSQACLPGHRLPSCNDKDGVHAQRRAHRVRPQPHRATSRCCTTPDGEKRYIIAPNKS
jgi:hypothetical protein